MTNRNGTLLTWNSVNLPTNIVENSSNSSSFSYAPDKHRYYQSAEIAGVSETTVYVGAFEAWTQAGSTTYHYHLMADNREVADVQLANNGSAVDEKIRYLLTDHLGSVDVVVKTNTGGTILTTTFMSFGAWGNRREPTTWVPPVSAAETQADHDASRYGFTHQEMLDNVNLIHMNGRVYDPNLGRFLSVDPVFEFPTNTQSLNPYSYVMNNPLSMTDPTGYAANPCAQQGSNTVCTFNTIVTGSHVAQSVTMTIPGKGGNVSFSGPLAGPGGHSLMLGDTMMTASAGMRGNGAQLNQGATDAQNKPTGASNINSPSSLSTGCGQLLCAGDKVDLNPYLSPKVLQTSNSQIRKTKLDEGFSPFGHPDPKIMSVGYGYHLNTLAKIRLYESVRNKNGSLSATAADFLTRNFESTYVHATIVEEVHAEMTQGQYNAASDYVYQHGSLSSGFRSDINHHMYIMAGFELFDPKYPGRTTQDVSNYLEATPEYSRMINSLFPNQP